MMEQSEIDDAVMKLGYHHNKRLHLCRELEALADALPSSIDNQHCLTIARQIMPTVREAHEFEERILFPILEELANKNAELAQSLERLRFEHWEDESFAEDLIESMRQYGSDDQKRDGEKLAYMLRGFFDGLRRHMAFEAEHLMPMLVTDSSPSAH